MEKSNSQRATDCFMSALKWGGFLGFVGVALGLFVATVIVTGSNDAESKDVCWAFVMVPLYFLFIGAVSGCILPLTFAMWHLFLSMLEQISGAVRRGR